MKWLFVVPVVAAVSAAFSNGVSTLADWWGPASIVENQCDASVKKENPNQEKFISCGGFL